MGSLFSTSNQPDNEERKQVRVYLTKILQSLNTPSVPFSMFEEMYYVFLKQYPKEVITREQFVEENSSVHGGPKELWNHVFNILLSDPDVNDGELVKKTDEVGFHELARHLLLPRNVEQTVKRAFRFYDTNNDGFLEEAEIVLVIKWIYELSESKVLRENPACVARYVSSKAQEDSLDNMLNDQGRVPLESVEGAIPTINDAMARAKALIRSMDVDGDGGLSEMEFSDGCRADQLLVELFTSLFERQNQ